MFFLLKLVRTAVIVLSPKNLKNMSNQILTLDDIMMVSSNTMRNVGAVLDMKSFWDFLFPVLLGRGLGPDCCLRLCTK